MIIMTYPYQKYSGLFHEVNCLFGIKYGITFVKVSRAIFFIEICNTLTKMQRTYR